MPQTRVQPPTDKGRRLKIYYMTQVGVKPPHFVLLLQRRAGCSTSPISGIWKTSIRSTFGLEGTPISLTIRQKGDKED